MCFESIPYWQCSSELLSAAAFLLYQLLFVEQARIQPLFDHILDLVPGDALVSHATQVSLTCTSFS